MCRSPEGFTDPGKEFGISRNAIRYPVALDNFYGTWQPYENRYWPAFYLFDTEGMLRRVHFGEGKYQEMVKDKRNHGGAILPRERRMDAVVRLLYPVCRSSRFSYPGLRGVTS